MSENDYLEKCFKLITEYTKNSLTSKAPYFIDPPVRVKKDFYQAKIPFTAFNRIFHTR